MTQYHLSFQQPDDLVKQFVSDNTEACAKALLHYDKNRIVASIIKQESTYPLGGVEDNKGYIRNQFGPYVDFVRRYPMEADTACSELAQAVYTFLRSPDHGERYVREVLKTELQQGLSQYPTTLFGGSSPSGSSGSSVFPEPTISSNPEPSFTFPRTPASKASSPSYPSITSIPSPFGNMPKPSSQTSHHKPAQTSSQKPSVSKKKSIPDEEESPIYRGGGTTIEAEKWPTWKYIKHFLAIVFLVVASVTGALSSVSIGTQYGSEARFCLWCIFGFWVACFIWIRMMVHLSRERRKRFIIWQLIGEICAFLVFLCLLGYSVFRLYQLTLHDFVSTIIIWGALCFIFGLLTWMYNFFK